MEENKGKIVSLIFITVIFMVAFIYVILAVSRVDEGARNYENHTLFIQIEGHDNLYYDPQEEIVYVIFSEMSGYKGYGYMSPYYASNGRPYGYDPHTGELVKIED